MNYLTRLFMANGLRSAISWLLLLLPLWAIAQQEEKKLFPDKPEPAVYVHDYAGWLQPYQVRALEQKLVAYWDSTSTQIVVMIRPDIGGYDKASYAFELANQWGIGRKDKDNGILMLIKSEPPERGIFIATGHGAEGALPDVTAGRIIRNTMAPYFKQQQYYEGINAGLDEIIAALEGEFQPATAEKTSIGMTIFVLLFIALIFFLILGTIVYKLRKFGQWIGSGRNNKNGKDDNFGGGWWIGGDGWGGSSGSGWGGGSSGGGWGGGSSGGSFGGGSFGGGGAGGDW